jgi:3-methyl-2-oxobutanoate hydroxymethyltransferase
MTTPRDKPAKITVPEFQSMKGRREHIAVLTAYDRPSARLLDEAGIDALLVGDSLGMVLLGYTTTLPVTLDEMIHHARAVAVGGTRALRIVDMPFLSYEPAPERALESAGRLVKEGDAEAVKLEGASPASLAAVRAIVTAGIPVMGHLGLTPQHVLRFGGYKVQGRARDDRRRLLEEARLLEENGAFSIVLECVPEELASEITSSLRIPTIGIGAGTGCDGQVLVLHDMLGISDGFRPRFVRRYAELGEEIRRAAAAYVEDVRAGRFPGPENAYTGEE